MKRERKYLKLFRSLEIFDLSLEKGDDVKRLDVNICGFLQYSRNEKQLKWHVSMDFE